MGATRRVIERVPTDKGEWRPHPKSFPLGHLAQLIAGMPGWFTSIMTSTSATLHEFQAVLATRRAASAASAAASDDDYEPDSSLTVGDQVLMTTPRYRFIRETLCHLSHHRGQMTVYLRLLDIPVPAIYGPSADDRPSMR